MTRSSNDANGVENKYAETQGLRKLKLNYGDLTQSETDQISQDLDWPTQGLHPTPGGNIVKRAMPNCTRSLELAMDVSLLRSGSWGCNSIFRTLQRRGDSWR